MKRKVLSALIVSAFAGVTTTASAGVIQASFKNFAAEVFGAEVAMIVPTIGYSLALPLTGTAANPNNFSITWTLNGGKWDPANLPDATLVSVNNVDFIQAATIAIDGANPKLLRANFNLNNGVTFPPGSTIVLGSVGANPAATDGSIVKVAPVLRVPADADKYCNPTTAEIKVTVRMTNAAGVEFESNFPGNSNTTPILQSGVAQNVSAVSSSTYTTPEASQVNVLIPALGKLFTNPADVTTASPDGERFINIGQMRIRDRASLFDLLGDVFYSVFDADWTAAVAADGGVSQNGISVRITGRFVSTGAVFAASDNACTTQIGSDASFNSGLTEATLNLTGADLDGLAATGATGTGSRTFFMCYRVPAGNTAVIPVSQFAVAGGSLSKDAGSNEIAAQVCPSTIYNLTANGVRVDVRNYIPQVVEAPSGGWRSVIRVINTDESQPSVDVVGTVLKADGTLGATAVIAAGMKPREVRYLTSAQIDTILNAQATGAKYDSADIPANARLRITAPSSSIRVQNYVFSPLVNNFFEASSSQGDDGVINTNPPTIADVIRSVSDSANK